MLFHTFSSQEERRKFGGTYFWEMQYCRLPRGTEIREIVSVYAIDHWRNDSLYIYGDDDFLPHYGEIFTGGIYNNLKSGMLDFNGINYFPQERTRPIIKNIEEMKPLDYQILLNWMEKAHEYNGFYILGI